MSGVCSLFPRDHPRGPWARPRCQLVATPAQSCLPLWPDLLPLHRVYFPQVLAAFTSSPLSSLCLTITLALSFPPHHLFSHCLDS